MKNVILLELAERWEVEALNETNHSVTETLRACADTIKSLVKMQETTGQNIITNDDDMFEAVQLLTSAHNIAKRKGADTNWEAFSKSISNLNIGYVTPRTFKIYPQDLKKHYFIMFFENRDQIETFIRNVAGNTGLIVNLSQKIIDFNGVIRIKCVSLEDPKSFDEFIPFNLSGYLLSENVKNLPENIHVNLLPRIVVDVTEEIINSFHGFLRIYNCTLRIKSKNSN